MRLFLFILILAAIIFSCKKGKDTPDPVPLANAKVCFQMSVVQEAILDSAVYFKNCSDSVGVTYRWDFGNSNISNEKDPSHVFSTPGKFDVTLTVLINGTIAGSISKEISVLIKERYIDILSVTTPSDFVELKDGSIFVVGTTSNATESKLYLSKFDKYLRPPNYSKTFK